MKPHRLFDYTSINIEITYLRSIVGYYDNILTYLSERRHLRLVTYMSILKIFQLDILIKKQWIDTCCVLTGLIPFNNGK